MSSPKNLVLNSQANSGDVESSVATAEYMASPSGSTTSGTSVGQINTRNHARTVSMATDASTSYRSNRFSVQFSTSSGRTSISEMRDSVPFNPETIASPPVPMDGNFLTAIATQERRVLELKEELEKAESILDTLKQHWAHHEARRKRDDARRLTQLQPLQTSFPAEDKDDTDSPDARMQQEMKRRKTLLSGTRSSNRTVFSGSRHTRALSLLSPKETTQPVAQRHLPLRQDSLRRIAHSAVDTIEQDATVRLSRSSTTAGSFGELFSHVNQQTVIPTTSIDHEALLREGKKMANNFKDGLWTFWEDLRQAAVGEEATNDHLPKKQGSSQTLRTARKQSSKNSLRPSSRGSSISKASNETKRPSSVYPAKANALPDLADPSFWSEHGMLTQNAAQTPKRKTRSSAKTQSPRSQHSVSSIDPWDTWDDSPVQSRTSSIVSEPITLPSTVSASPRTGTGANHEPADSARKDPLPWPTITRAGTSTLRRSVSHLMQEWDNLDISKSGEGRTSREDLPITGSEPTSVSPEKHGSEKID